MKKVKIDLNEIEIKDLEGTVYPIDGLHKVLGNVLFKGNTIEVSDIGRELHGGKLVEVDQELLKDITTTISNDRKYMPWVHSQIVSYFASKIDELNTDKATE